MDLQLIRGITLGNKLFIRHFFVHRYYTSTYNLRGYSYYTIQLTNLKKKYTYLIRMTG